MSDLVGNPEDRLFRVMAHKVETCCVRNTENNRVKKHMITSSKALPQVHLN